jgi:hypothetical protein
MKRLLIVAHCEQEIYDKNVYLYELQGAPYMHVLINLAVCLGGSNASKV